MVHPFSLNNYLGALNGDLGCFPLDNEAYPPLSHCLVEIKFSIQSLPQLGTTFIALTETVLYPYKYHN